MIRAVRRFPLLPIAAALLTVAGCATVPKPLQGDFVSDSPAGTVPPDGARVRWGGTILSVEPKPGITCFQILARDLGETARPRLTRDHAEGRFLACRNGFYDPAIFERGREVTVTGNVSGNEIRKVGDYDYQLPRIAADTVYLWPERPQYEVAYGVGYGYPFWYSDPWWGFGYHRQVIVVPRRPHRHH
jgi:outer membrane lipoprotein